MSICLFVGLVTTTLLPFFFLPREVYTPFVVVLAVTSLHQPPWFHFCIDRSIDMLGVYLVNRWIDRFQTIYYYAINFSWQLTR
ncbi:hypothetical protein F5884DRAFT_356939 [Xylogone sp. PMI_703]|nr:hypothetical protein F5884DRAFT_356939 [Xylogone sp. PMI_703]